MKTTVCLLSLLLATSAALADPLDKAQVSSEAKWVAHLDAEKFKTSEVGEYIMAELQKEENQFAAVEALMHFDPRKDFSAMTLYAKSGEEEDAVMLMKGQFDKEHLTTLVRANETFESFTFGEHAIGRWIDDDKAKREGGSGVTYGSFFSDKLVVIGSKRDTVEHALSVLSGKATNLAQSSPHLTELPESGNFYLVAAANMTKLGDFDPEAKVFKKAKSSVLQIGEKDRKLTGQMRMTTDTEDTAEQISMVVEGIRAMLLLGADEEPEQAKLARAIGVNFDGKKVNLELSFPIDEMLDLMQAEKGNIGKTREERRKERRKKRVD